MQISSNICRHLKIYGRSRFLSNFLQNRAILKHSITFYSSQVPNNLHIFRKNEIKPIAYSSRPAIPFIIEKQLNICIEALSRPQTEPDFAQNVFLVISLELFRIFNGAKIILHPQLKDRKDRPSSSSVPAVRTEEVFLKNQYFENTNVLSNFEMIIDQYIQVCVKHKDVILANPSLFLKAIQWGSKFEKFHQNSKVWAFTYEVIDFLKNQPETLEYQNMHKIAPFLRELCTHKRYWKEQVQTDKTGEAIERLNRVTETQNNLFSYLAKNGYRNFTELSSIAVGLEIAKDEMVYDVIDLLRDVLESIEDLDRVSSGLTKMGRFNDVKHFSDLIDKIKNVLYHKAQKNELTIGQLSKIIAFSAVYDMFFEKVFPVYWNNFCRNFQEKKLEGLDLQCVQLLLYTLDKKKVNTKESSYFLQECALIAIDYTYKSDAKNSGDLKKLNSGDEEGQITAGEEVTDDEWEEWDKREDDNNIAKLDIMSLQKILSVLTTKESNVNYHLVEKIISILINEIHLIEQAMWHKMMNYMAKIINPLEENPKTNAPQQVKDLAMNLFNLIGEKFLTKINSCSLNRVVYGFKSYCLIGKIDQSIYDIFLKSLIAHHPNMTILASIYILVNISRLKKKGINIEPNNTILEEMSAQKVCESLSDCHPEILLNISFCQEQIINLACAKKIVAEFEAEILRRPSLFSYTSLGCIIFHLNKSKHLSHNFLNKVAPYLSAELEKYDTLNVLMIARTYKGNNINHPGLLEAIEKFFVKKMIGFKGRIDPENLKSTLVAFMLLSSTKWYQPELLETVEKVFQKNLGGLGQYEIVCILTGMLTYSSQNIPVIKDLLKRLNELCLAESHKKEYLKIVFGNAPRKFLTIMADLKLEYKNQIELSQYTELEKIFQYLNKNFKDKPRERRTQKPQNFVEVVKQLASMKYPFDQNIFLGPYIVEVLIKPNIAVLLTMPEHYVDGTHDLLLAYQKKIRQLSKMGNKVAVIHYFEWEKLGKAGTSKESYLREKIKNA